MKKEKKKPSAKYWTNDVALWIKTIKGSMFCGTGTCFVPSINTEKGLDDPIHKGKIRRIAYKEARHLFPELIAQVKDL